MGEGRKVSMEEERCEGPCEGVNFEHVNGKTRSRGDAMWTSQDMFTRKFREDNVIKGKSITSITTSPSKIWTPLHGLHRLPSTTAGFRSTFSKASFIHGVVVLCLI
jgi:hypothetical protein